MTLSSVEANRIFNGFYGGCLQAGITSAQRTDQPDVRLQQATLIVLTETMRDGAAPLSHLGLSTTHPTSGPGHATGAEIGPYVTTRGNGNIGLAIVVQPANEYV